MTNQNEQPKMYRLLTQLGYTSFVKGNIYHERDTFNNGTATVADMVEAFPRDWKQVIQKATKTHLSESQHQSLVTLVSEGCRVFKHKAESIIAQWAETNNIELP